MTSNYDEYAAEISIAVCYRCRHDCRPATSVAVVSLNNRCGSGALAFLFYRRGEFSTAIDTHDM
jgi:hypothetical protein